MKEKDKWAAEYIQSIKTFERAPGLTDIYLAGFQAAKDKLLDLCDAKHQVITYIEINRIGEKQVK